MSFGESLIGIRTKKRISRKDFAELLGIPYTTLRNYETDQREPGHNLLIKMATLLNVSVDDLVGYHPENEKTPSVSDEAMRLAQDYDGLDKWGKKQVRSTADIEMERMAEALARAAEAIGEENDRTRREMAAEIASKTKTPTPVTEDGQDDLSKEALKLFQSLDPGQKQQYLDLMRGTTNTEKP